MKLDWFLLIVTKDFSVSVWTGLILDLDENTVFSPKHI